MDPIKEWWIEEKAKKAVERLAAHDFKAIYVKTKVEAVQEVLEADQAEGENRDRRIRNPTRVRNLGKIGGRRLYCL